MPRLHRPGALKNRSEDGRQASKWLSHFGSVVLRRDTACFYAGKASRVAQRRSHIRTADELGYIPRDKFISGFAGGDGSHGSIPRS
jgi:hypothetical protein